MNWYASDYDKVKASESSFKSRKTIKLTCSFQQTYSIWPMLLACHFRINSFRKAATQTNSQQPYEVGVINVPILQIIKLRPQFSVCSKARIWTQATKHRAFIPTTVSHVPCKISYPPIQIGWNSQNYKIQVTGQEGNVLVPHFSLIRNWVGSHSQIVLWCGVQGF